MSVLAEYDFYSELCDGTMYGMHFLELPQRIIDRLDDYFDGQTITMGGGGNHPDNVYVNSYTVEDDESVVTYWTRMLTEEEYVGLEESGQLEQWLDQHREEIEERLNDKVYVLDYDSGYWHFLQ